MTFISTLCTLTAYGAIFSIMLLARLDYRALRKPKGVDWDAV